MAQSRQDTQLQFLRKEIEPIHKLQCSNYVFDNIIDDGSFFLTRNTESSFIRICFIVPPQKKILTVVTVLL